MVLVRLPLLTRLVLRRNPVLLALTAYDIWRRLPPRQRKAALALARKHGPRLALKLAQNRAGKKPKS
jgi:hypothetical protein